MTPKSSIVDIKQLIGDAKNAEMCRDIKSLRTILKTFWTDYNQFPNLEEFEPQVRAELLRLCGFFLTFYGRSQNLIEYQSKAKDLLTNALEIFDTQNLTVGAAKTRITLAFCYWNSGEVSEADSILSTIETEYENSKHPIFLQSQINRLLFLA